jgi:prophage regulatory protein
MGSASQLGRDHLMPVKRPAAVEDALVLPEYLGTNDLERITGTKATTWRYWEHARTMPPAFPASFKIGRRRVWPKGAVLAWLAEQERAANAAAV